MKKCVKCGCEIVNGINGCMLMDECRDCYGGYPEYPPPKRVTLGEGISYDELNYLEGRCIDDE